MKTININIGLLGHIDSGKTSLAKCLSTKSSTAAFDKNPQSQERGITLDLGFSTFNIEPCERIRAENADIDQLQITLVDCPGHASLIKTIIIGATIIDLLFLIVDITKGMQTQTAESLVIGEITCSQMIVVINKIDLIENVRRQDVIDKMSKKLCKTLERTRFKDSPIVAVSSRAPLNSPESNIQSLMRILREKLNIPKRSRDGSCLFAVDHCFNIRGQGTVLTGTMLRGVIKVNDTIEIPTLNVTKKVKSIQMFRKPVEEAAQGDRIGICVTQFDSKLLERGVVSAPNQLKFAFAIICRIHLIPYFKGECRSKSKFHVTILHETVLARVEFFEATVENEIFNESNEYRYLCDDINDKSIERNGNIFVLIEFEKSVVAGEEMLMIGSKLDVDHESNQCRLAFHGKIERIFVQKDFHSSLASLKIFKTKERCGFVERISNDYEVIGKSMFKKETNLTIFIGLKVYMSTGEVGKIEAGFGQSGKVRISFRESIRDSELDRQLKTGKPVAIRLPLTCYLFDKTKKFIQV